MFALEDVSTKEDTAYESLTYLSYVSAFQDLFFTIGIRIFSSACT